MCESLSDRLYPRPSSRDSICRWLKETSVKREDIIIASKVAGFSDMMTWLPGRDGKGARVNRDQIIKSVDASLERLGTDHIDLLQIHWPDRYAVCRPAPRLRLPVKRFPLADLLAGAVPALPASRPTMLSRAASACSPWRGRKGPIVWRAGVLRCRQDQRHDPGQLARAPAPVSEICRVAFRGVWSQLAGAFEPVCAIL